jgi:hypothetical protein
MAQIPSGQKFHTVPSNVQTVERGSALANSQREIFTMQDIIDTVGGGGGTNYTVVPADGTPIENGSAFKSAYLEAIASTPNGEALGFYNQFYVLLSPGYYEFEDNLNLSDAWVNVVSLTGLRDVFIIGSYTLNVTAYAVYIQGIDTGELPFSTSGTSSAQVIENCKGGNYSFGYSGGAYGTYINCSGSLSSFGGNSIAGGIFTNCNGGPLSFGGGYGGTQATGIFKNCSSSSESFGGFNGTASGTFDACSGGNNSFGGGISGNASGIFTFCSIQGGSFPTPTTGRFVYCHQSGIPYNAGFIAQNKL